MPLEYRTYLPFHPFHHDPLQSAHDVRQLNSLQYLATWTSSTWCLVTAGLLFTFPMIYMQVRDTTTLDDEAMFVLFFIVFSLERDDRPYIPL